MSMNISKKKIIIVYNPSAGRGDSYETAKKIADKLQDTGSEEITVFSNHHIQNLSNYFMFLDEKPFGTIVVVGGDGTLSTVVNAVLQNDIDMDIAVYPSGTANDFSSSLGMKKNIDKFVKMIRTQTPQFSDVASVNDAFAVNAIGSGNFSHASMTYNQKYKRIFGKFAYYAKCVLLALKMKPDKIKVRFDNETISDDFLFYYIVNSKVAGGFRRFSPQSKIDDGKMFFVGIRRCNFITFCFLFLKILFGTHTTSKYVVYKSSATFFVETDIRNKKFILSDIDGNLGPKHPLEVKVIKNRIRVFSNQKNTEYI